jgi:hypothetical protein
LGVEDEEVVDLNPAASHTKKKGGGT